MEEKNGQTGPERKTSKIGSVEQLEQAIRQYMEHPNANPKTFVWTKFAEDILENFARARTALNKFPSE